MGSDVSDGQYGEFVPSQYMCNYCSKSRKAEKLRLEIEEEKARNSDYVKAQAKYLRSPEYKRREKEYRETGLHATQCEYCGKVFDLTKEDFVEHQDVCKADNAQI